MNRLSALGWRHCCLVVAALLVSLATWSTPALAQESPAPRLAVFRWTPERSGVLADFGFRDVVDSEIEKKLSRGLPTTIIFTGLVYVQGAEQPIAATLQTCRITWHVWEEMYRVETTRPNSKATTRHWTPTVNGVLRRCAAADGLLIADKDQMVTNQAVYVRGKVQVNPISPEVMAKIKQWISRPSPTRTVTIGNTLFSTFTGLFMQRISDAERTLELLTLASVPLLPAKK